MHARNKGSANRCVALQRARAVLIFNLVKQSLTTLRRRLRNVGWGLLVARQKAMAKILTYLYGSPMQVLPAGHVALAGALVLWVAQNGGRQMLFVRNPTAKDPNARLTSFFGLGKHEDMAAAMRASARAQLGESFCKTLKINKIGLDNIAAAPMFTYTDDANGIVTPVQTLVWVMQVQPMQLELLALPPEHELVIIPESSLRNSRPANVSPTHIAILRSTLKHLPLKKLPEQTSTTEPDDHPETESKPDKKQSRRLLH